MSMKAAMGLCLAAMVLGCSQQSSLERAENELMEAQSNLYWYAPAQEALREAFHSYRAKFGRYPDSATELSSHVGESIPYVARHGGLRRESLKLTDVWFKYEKTDSDGTWFKTQIRDVEGGIGVDTDPNLLKSEPEKKK